MQINRARALRTSESSEQPDHGCDTHVRTARAALFLALIWLCLAPRAAAQDPVPKIGPFALDLHGTFPRFSDNLQLAQSRDLQPVELPGMGLGLHASANFYVFTWKAITFGVGGDAAFARAHSGPQRISETVTGRAVTER